jgi:tetratricopeptide (TPR) repeat protein
MPYFEVCKALSEYRQGHYDRAVEWAQQPLKIDGNESHGHAYAVLAMANWRLEKTAEAQAMLAKGNDLAPGSMPADIAEDPGDRWEHWLYARIQMDEATALIQRGSTTNN